MDCDRNIFTLRVVLNKQGANGGGRLHQKSELGGEGGQGNTEENSKVQD